MSHKKKAHSGLKKEMGKHISQEKKDMKSLVKEDMSMKKKMGKKGC